MPIPGFLNKFVTDLTNRLSNGLTLETPLAGEVNPVKPEKRSLLNKVLGDKILYDRFTKEGVERVAHEYLPMIGLGREVNFSDDTFDNLAKNRVVDVTKLAEVKIPGGGLLHEKLSEMPADEVKKTAISAVKETLNSKLQAGADFNEAQTDYKASITAFKELVQQIPSKYRANDLVGALQEVVDTGITAIEVQQKKEVDALIELFNDEGFKANLQKALDIPPEKNDSLKASMIEELQNNHKKQLEEFKKSTQDSMLALHKASEKQMKEFLFKANMHKNDPEMRLLIERAAEENRAKGASGAHTSLEFSKNKADISSVDLSQLEYIQRLGGGKIIPTKIGKEDGYSLEMGMKIFNPRYYFNGHHKKDMEMMAQAIRASGSEAITMTVRFDNPKIAEARAREAFEACVKSGFPPDKVTIRMVVGGQEKVYKATAGEKISSHESLFGDKQGRYQEILKRAAETREEMGKIIEQAHTKPSNERILSSIKSELNELKAKARVPAVEPAPVEEEVEERRLER